MLLIFKFTNKKLTGVGLLILSVILFSQFQSCKESSDEPLKEQYKGDNLDWSALTKLSPSQIKEYEQGTKLAQTYCSGCHEYVAPQFLDRITWPRVLSVMEEQMDKQGYLISHDEWIKIQQFYLLFAAKTFYSTQKQQQPTLQTQFLGKVFPFQKFPNQMRLC